MPEAKKGLQYFIGVDEVGRGPLAGPVAVGIVVSRKRYPVLPVKNIKDSKKLSPQKRRAIASCVKEFSRRGELFYAVSFVGASLIDRIGINRSILLAMKRALVRLSLPPQNTYVLLDGGLRAPKQFHYQETIIGGDDKEPLISLASIVAKVARDAKMERISRDYPLYGFDIHKGYGTSLHFKMLAKYDTSPLHRMSFLKKWSSRRGMRKIISGRV